MASPAPLAPLMPVGDCGPKPVDPPDFPAEDPGHALTAWMMDEVDQIFRKHRLEVDDFVRRWVQESSRQGIQESSGNVFMEPATPSSHVITEPAAHNSHVFTESTAPNSHVFTKSVAAKSAPRNGPAEPSHDHLLNRSTPNVPALEQVRKMRADPTAFESGDTKPAYHRTGGKKQPRKSPTELLFGSPTTELVKTTPQRCTSSKQYEWASGTLIMLNAAFIGWQTQYFAEGSMKAAAARQPIEQETPISFLVMQGIFTLLFLIELIPRWVAEGLVGFFRSDDKLWNGLDVAVITLSIGDFVMGVTLRGHDILGNLSVLRVVRVVRMVRVVKVIRILKFFRELRMMIFSIMRSMKALLWVVLVLAMTFYVFGIVFTVAVSMTLDTTEDWLNPETNDLRTYFGTLDRSVVSLFMAMSGGKEWCAFYNALGQLPPPYQTLFLMYITFCIFAVVNIVTGVFVESALQSQSEDKLITAHEELESKKEYLNAMRSIFKEMDEDNTGTVTLEQFEAKLADERCIAYFAAMKLDVSDAKKLFWLLDYDHSDFIDIDEFVCGCYALQGESRSLDMKMMECEVHSLRNCFHYFIDTMSRVDACLHDLLNMKRHHGMEEI